MDSLISAAGRALAAGDALSALQRVALRDDPPALALRGIAMAQLGEHARARELLRRAARGFGAHEAMARARCVVAEAEVALAMRDFSGAPRALDAAMHTLAARGDRPNACQARLIAARRLMLLGRLGEASAMLAQPEGPPLPPLLQAVAALLCAELALRGLRPDDALHALLHAEEAARQAGVGALQAEVSETRAVLDRPAARCLIDGSLRTLRLHEVAALMASGDLLVDACRHEVRMGELVVPLVRRPILFTLLRALAEAWPGDVDRDALIAGAFRMREADETHRARLRVQMGRLRALLAPFGGIQATNRGFALHPLSGCKVTALLPPVEGEQGELLALLADGVPWSTSALAQATGASQRTVQRALAELEAAGRVRATGQTRSRRWLAPPLSGFTTILLLPAALPSG